MTPESAVLAAVREHPSVWSAPLLCGYTDLSLREFSRVYRRLVRAGHIAKGGPIHGLAKKEPGPPLPQTTHLFEEPLAKKERARKPRKSAARAPIEGMTGTK